MEPRIARSAVAVKAPVYPYDKWHDRYQRYYQEGLALYLQSIGLKLERESRTRLSVLLKMFRHIRDAGPVQRLVGRHAGMVTRYLEAPTAPLVGEYRFWPNSPQGFKMCIDSHDSRHISSPALLETCDIYVKTNYWTSITYDPRVVPFYNCNPVVLPYIEKLKAMRSQQPVYDLCFIVRVWGGSTGTEAVEHCLQLLEAAAKVRAKTFLLAELVVGDTAEQARRLRSRGIFTTTKRISLRELWDISAQSRVNMFRLGNHHCMSWRMTDLFAMGACIALDQHPKTRWPVPVEHGTHYVSLGAATSDEAPVAPAPQYAVIPELLEELLAQRQLIDDMRRHTAAYFDKYLHPFQIGRQLYDLTFRQQSTGREVHADTVRAAPEAVTVQS